MEVPETMPYLKFFTFINWSDKVLLIFGTFSAIIAGMILPSISVIMGNISVAFTNKSGSGGEDIMEEMDFIA